jgi:hypothetical protein
MAKTRPPDERRQLVRVVRPSRIGSAGGSHQLDRHDLFLKVCLYVSENGVMLALVQSPGILGIPAKMHAQ